MDVRSCGFSKLWISEVVDFRSCGSSKLWILSCGVRVVDIKLWISSCGFRVVDVEERSVDVEE